MNFLKNFNPFSYETTPGTSGWGPVADGAVYGRNLQKQDAAKKFLNAFTDYMGDGRSANTQQAKDFGGLTAKSGGGGQMSANTSQLAPDVFLREGDDTSKYSHVIPGEPGKKGFLGTAISIGSSFLPGVGPMVGQAVAPHFDYV